MKINDPSEVNQRFNQACRDLYNATPFTDYIHVIITEGGVTAVFKPSESGGSYAKKLDKCVDDSGPRWENNHIDRSCEDELS